MSMLQRRSKIMDLLKCVAFVTRDWPARTGDEHDCQKAWSAISK